jgi:hypothetical protein
MAKKLSELVGVPNELSDLVQSPGVATVGVIEQLAVSVVHERIVVPELPRPRRRLPLGKSREGY